MDGDKQLPFTLSDLASLSPADKRNTLGRFEWLLEFGAHCPLGTVLPSEGRLLMRAIEFLHEVAGQ